MFRTVGKAEALATSGPALRLAPPPEKDGSLEIP
jgi:hypothetical protein